MNERTHGYFIALEDLIGQKVVLSDLLTELTKIRRSDVFCLVASVTELLRRDDGFNNQKQIGFLRETLDKDLWAKLEKALKNQPDNNWTLFTRKQLWLVLQFTLLIGRDDAPELSDAEAKKVFSYCCLMANDILKQIELVPFPHELAKDGLPLFIAIMVASAEMTLGHEVLARFQLLWLEIPEEPSIKLQAAALGIPSLNEAFAAKYGISLRDFIAILTVMMYKFTQTIISPIPQPLVFDPVVMFQRSHDADVVEKVLCIISCTPDELAVLLLGTPRQS